MAIRTGRATTRRTLADNRWMILSSTSYVFSAMYDDTRIFANGVLVDTLNKQDIKTISLSANDIIYSNRPISFSRSGSGQTGIPYAWEGILFAHRSDRYSVAFYMVATRENATVEIEDSRNLGTNYWSGTVSTTSYTTVSVGDTNSQFIVRSLDNSIAVYAGDLSSSDCLPLYPCTTELFGTASNDGHMIATEDGTTITEYSTDGGTITRTLNKGDQSGFTYDSGSQFSGRSVRLVSDKPIAAESQADSDGGEMTPFAGRDAFGKVFVIPENEREFVKLVSDVPAVAKAYDTSGTLLSTTTLAGSSTNSVYNARLTGTSSYEGVLIETDQPVYAIYEGEADDETVLFGHYPDEVSVTYSPSIVTDGLVLCLDAANPKSYPGSGNTWFDLSGNGNDGTNSNMTLGSNNSGYFLFNDSSSVSTINNDPSLNPISGLTIESLVWFDGNSNDFIFEKGNVNTQYSLFSHGNDVVFRTKHVGDSSYNSLDITKSSLGVSNERWHHIIGTWDGTTKQLYIDGVGKNTITKTNDLVTTSPGAAVGRFGGTTTGYYFGGKIAKIAIYNRGLSAAEIQQNFNALRGRYNL